MHRSQVPISVLYAAEVTSRSDEKVSAPTSLAFAKMVLFFLNINKKLTFQFGLICTCHLSLNLFSIISPLRREKGKGRRGRGHIFKSPLPACQLSGEGGPEKQHFRVGMWREGGSEAKILNFGEAEGEE